MLFTKKYPEAHLLIWNDHFNNLTFAQSKSFCYHKPQKHRDACKYQCKLHQTIITVKRHSNLMQVPLCAVKTALVPQGMNSTRHLELCCGLRTNLLSADPLIV